MFLLLHSPSLPWNGLKMPRGGPTSHFENLWYIKLHVWNKDLMCFAKHWPPSIILVGPTAAIHTTVTNSSQSLMESIKPCKYLQDKRASRQSISIYRTMESSTMAVLQVRKINKVNFGGGKGGTTTLQWHLLIFHSNALLPSIILTFVLIPLFFFPQVQVWHRWMRFPASIGNHRERVQPDSRRQLLKKEAASGCDRLSKKPGRKQHLPVEVLTGRKVK